MNSRRLMFPQGDASCSPQGSGRISVSSQDEGLEGPKMNFPQANADVRFGSLADILRCGSHVRLTPESGHMQCNNKCPLNAKSGHCAPN